MKINLLAIALVCLLVCACKGSGSDTAATAELNDQEKELIKLDPSKASARELFDASLDIHEYLAKGFYAQPDVFKAHIEVLKAKAQVERAKRVAINIEDTKAAAKEIKAAEKVLEEQEKAFKAFQLRVDALKKQRSGYIAAISKAAQTSEQKAEIETAFKTRPAAAFRTRMYALSQAFNNLRDGKLSDPAARASAQSLDIWVRNDALADEVRDAIANTMTQTINDFYSDWDSVSLLKNGTKSLIEDTISPYIFLKRPEDLGPLKPYQPLTADELPILRANLEHFAARYPNGAIATEFAKKDSSELLQSLGNADAGGMPEREVVEHVINDLKAAYTNDNLEPVKTFRIAMVTMYSQASSLSTPNPLALAIAIIGSLALFGGLALSVLRAVKSGRAVDIPPST